MFDKLKELLNKKKGGEDEYLDFSNYSDIEPERSQEDKTIVPDLKTEILKSSKVPKPVDDVDLTEVTENVSEKISLGTRISGLVDRYKNKNENLAIEKFDDDSGKKKTVVRLILILLIAILLAIVIDDTFQEEEVLPPTPVLKPKFPKRKVAPQPKPQTAPVEAPSEEVEPEDLPVNEEAAEEVLPQEDPAAEEPVSDQPETMPEPMPEKEIKAEESSSDDEMETSEEDSEPTPAEVTPEGAEDSEVFTDDEMSEEPPLTTTTTTLAVVTTTTLPAQDMIEDISKEELAQIEKDFMDQGESEEITDLSDLSVNYLASGAGLVYNCVGKHWACVSKVNFAKCKKLSGLSPKRCQVFNFYKSKKYCQVEQIQKINSNTNTDFCY